jgi:predicted transcriptional regulator
MSTLRIGIATYEEMKARTMAIARGEITPSPTDPKVWFPSMESAGKVLSAGNMMLLGVIASQRPQSLDELAQITGRHKSNLSRTLHTMEKYGLVDLVHGERGRIVPNVLHQDVSIGFSINESSQTKVTSSLKTR